LSHIEIEMLYDCPIVRECIAPRRLLYRRYEWNIAQRKLLGSREKANIGWIVRDGTHDDFRFDHRD
jgi:hypothetical protein